MQSKSEALVKNHPKDTALAIPIPFLHTGRKSKDSVVVERLKLKWSQNFSHQRGHTAVQ